MSSTDSQDAARRTLWPALVLAAAAAVLIAAGLLGGLLGFSDSETFTLGDARKVRGEMYLHRIDVSRWSKPPFVVIDDARHGSSGSLTRFYIDGEEVTDRRVSTSVLQQNAKPGFLHAGVHNLYFAIGPGDRTDAELTVEYVVTLDRESWLALVIAGGILLVAVAGFMTGMAMLCDLALITLVVTTAVSAWLHVSGLRFEDDLNELPARHLKPHGYLVQLPRPWPLEYRATDRINLDISGQLLLNGAPVGNAMGLSAEISGVGDGVHVMANGGAFYYSVPGNIDPAGLDLSVRAEAYLPWRLLALSGGCLLLVMGAGLAGGVTPALGVLLRRRPTAAAIILPGAGAVTVAGYLGWMIWIDPLHLHSPPEETDWFARDEAWRMAGLVRTYPYRGIILGTSVSQNYYMPEASAVLGRPMLNATMAGSTPHEQAQLARLALERSETELVVWEMHANSFVLPADEIRAEHFPAYLFDENPLLLLEYYFSLQAWLDANAKRKAHEARVTEPLDPINKWGERTKFGPEVLAAVYCERRHRTTGILNEEALRRNLRLNVAPAALSRPDVRFILFLPAYSVLFHLPKGGRTMGMERFAEIVLEETAHLPNVEVHDFLGLGEVIADPAKYKDDIHAHPSINSHILHQIAHSRFRVRRDSVATHRESLKNLFDRTSATFRQRMDPMCSG